MLIFGFFVRFVLEEIFFSESALAVKYCPEKANLLVLKSLNNSLHYNLEKFHLIFSSKEIKSLLISSIDLNSLL